MTLTQDIRVCRTCGVSKDIKQFPSRYRWARGSESISTQCKACLSDYRRSNRTMKRNHLRRLYGIELEQYDSMLLKQNGKCAICGCPAEFSAKGSLAVDHDHATEKVRALLCGECNTGLGKFKDSPELLAKAREYLLCP